MIYSFSAAPGHKTLAFMVPVLFRHQEKINKEQGKQMVDYFYPVKMMDEWEWFRPVFFQ